MCNEKKFYEETNHMIDSRDIYGYIKMMINPYGKPFEGTIFEFGNKLMDYIIRMKKQPKVGEWIPHSERLPEKSGYYLYCADSPHIGLKDGIGVSYFQHKAKEWKKVYTPCVIAWMPLPEPYKGE